MRRQSEHFADYRAALEKLTAMGLVYPRFESRAEIARLVAAAGETRRHGRAIPTARRFIRARRSALAPEARTRLIAIRRALRAAARHGGGLRARGRSELDRARRGPGGETGTVAADPAGLGRRHHRAQGDADQLSLAVVVDDALQGVTEVVRGEDLFWSTSVHRLLQALLGLPQPAYRHHRLIRDAAGQKLSKSTEATGLRELRAGGRHAGRDPPPGRPRLNAYCARCQHSVRDELPSA